MWINPFGLGFVIAILVPNIIFAAKFRNSFKNSWHNKPVESLEQVGRFCSMAFMVIFLNSIWQGFSSAAMLFLYIIINVFLIAAYWLCWGLYFQKKTSFLSILLAAIPSAIFLFSGVITCYIPLVFAAMIFTPCHILITYKNAVK